MAFLLGGTFIVGHFLGAAELGYYKTPVTFVSGCFGIITNATTPILFSSLSRLQFDREEYVAYLRRFQFMVALFLLPLSAGIFVFREPLVALLLGDQWGEATLMFGLYGLVQGPDGCCSHTTAARCIALLVNRACLRLCR